MVHDIKPVELALYVPYLRSNVISISKIADKGYSVVFRDNTAEVIDRDRNVVPNASRENNLYNDRGTGAECRNAGEASGKST